MSQRSYKWILFATLSIFLPLLYYMFVVIGIWPLGHIAFLTLVDRNPIGFLLFNSMHIVIYCFFLYYLARSIARLVWQIPVVTRNFIASGIVILPGIVGLFPIYGGGHSSITFTSAYELYWAIFKDYFAF